MTRLTASVMEPVIERVSGEGFDGKPASGRVSPSGLR